MPQQIMDNFQPGGESRDDTMISIVVPVFNEEESLADCLRSLIRQDYTADREIVVVDNGSTDKSVSIAESFGARVVRCAAQQDVFAARQCGALAAHGEIVVQADADTIYPSDWLSRIATYFCDPQVVAVAGTFVYRTPVRWAATEVFLRHFMNSICLRVIGRPSVISGANFAFRREAFLKTRGYARDLYAPDQYGLATQLSRLGRVLYAKTLTASTSPRRRVESPLVALLFFRNLFRGFAHAFRDRRAIRMPAPLPKKAQKSLPWLAIRLFPLLALTALIADGYFIPSSTVFGHVYSKAKTGDKVIALTFDNGPNEPYTSEILDILDSYGIKATFFVTGKNAQLYPDTVRRMIAEGDVVGNNSYSYDADHALTYEGMRNMDRGQQAIFSVAGVEPHLYRPPLGQKSPWELYHARRKHVVEVNWNIATNESHTKDFEVMANNIVKRARPGGIIDLHDAYGDPEANKSLTVKALPLIIEGLQNEGYSFETIPELLHVPAYNTPGQ